MKYKILVLALSICVIFSRNAYCTIEWPGVEREENLVEKYRLSNIDRIIVKVDDFENKISNKNDITNILAGFAKCGANDHCKFWSKQRGELIFFSKNNEILRLILSFHYYTPLFFRDDTCYMYKNEQDTETFFNYLPVQVKDGLEKTRDQIRRGILY